MNRFQPLIFGAALACMVAGTATAFAADYRVVRGAGASEDTAHEALAALTDGARLDISGTECLDWAPAEGQPLTEFATEHATGDYTLVLLDLPGVPEVGAIDPAGRIAVVNRAALAAGEADEAAVAARFQREILRAHAWLLGIRPCPFPLCVLLPCPSAEDLDGMSRSYCPPCWERVRDRALEEGLPVLPLQNP